MTGNAPLQLAIVGAGPVGLTLALLAARRLPTAQVTVYDARPADKDVSADGRTLALSLGSVELLDRLGGWTGAGAQPILEVHVTQQPPSLPGPLASLLGEPTVRLTAADAGVAQLGAVLPYGKLVAHLQQVWADVCAADPARLTSRYGTPVTACMNVESGVEIDAGIVERYDLGVVAEGGVFATQARKALAHDYGQTAWVGRVTRSGHRAGVAYERFTRHGPAALLPLPGDEAALVWCADSANDPIADLDDAQRLTVLNTVFDADVGRITSVTPLKRFALGLNAERTLTDGRTVRIGNAAQTMHPVAGQGLNLGLRDAYELVDALTTSTDVPAVLRRLEWQRGPDRWAMIAATDFLARSFTWALPGAGALRGLGLAALQFAGPVKAMLARQMMYGSR